MWFVLVNRRWAFRLPILIALISAQVTYAQSGPSQTPDSAVVTVLSAAAPEEELRPIKMGCGKKSSVTLPPNLSVEVKLTGTFDNAAACCNQARIACSNELLETIESFVPTTVCPGCTCPNCGAKSCESLPKLPPNHLTITNEFQYGDQHYCDLYAAREGDKINSCQMWCKLPSSANVKLEAGCTECATNHVLDSKVAQVDPSTAMCAD